MVDSTDLKTRETGATGFAVQRSRNGGALVAYTTPTITEISAGSAPGVYSILIDEDTTVASTSDSEEYMIHVTATGCAPVTRSIELYRPKITAGNTLDVTATGAAGIDWGNIENPTTAQNLSATNIDVDQVVASVSGAVTVGTINANVITATSIAADAITDAKVAADVTIASVTGSVGSVTAGVSVAVGGLTSTSFAAGAIDAAAIAADAITSSELAQSAAQEIADEVLNRDIAGGGSGNTRNVRNALRAIRNKVSEASGTLTVTQEDDTTPAWTATVVRTPNTNPLTSVDPT